MPRPAPGLTLCLLIDALRPDYVTRAPFLRELARSSATGFLRECFGFVPRAAYFGGLTAEQYGFTNMYCFDPANSPFGIAKALPSAKAGVAVEHHLGIRQLVEASARERVAPFARLYASSAEIPLPCLPYFDLVEQRAPWDRQVGYESLFALLDRHGLPWYQCSWPDTNRLADRSDEGIVRQVLADLRPEHRFAYVHLQELDGTGHLYGPNSRELQSRLLATDQRCRRLINELRARHDRVNVVLFGDHGMVNVTRALDLWRLLRETGLKFGADFAFFLDSTMARFWFYHARARSTVEAALADVPGGRLLNPDELRRHGIAGCDPRNGEMIFLADPGVLIFPNFFQGDADPIKGMHGYDPDCPDNLGFFLLHDPGDPALSGADLGRIDPPSIFPLLARLLELPVPAADCRIVRPRPAPPARRFTAHPDPAADQFVQTQLEQIVQAVTAAVGRPEAIVLTGSFGRGEGGVYRDASGQFRPVNDYDLLVVSPHDCGAALKQLSAELPAKLGIDFVDLGWSDGRWAQLPLTIQHYDLKYGSQVVAGDPAVLDRIPAYASADLPIYEAVKLLLNRTAGLLTALRGEFLAPHGVPAGVVAAGVSPAVEPGVSPGGNGARAGKTSSPSAGQPGGAMPPSTAGTDARRYGTTVPAEAGTPCATTRPTPDQRRYLTNQYVKALLALGDWHLIRWEGYDASYRLRRQRFASLARGAGLAADLIERVLAAYDFKLLPDYDRLSAELADLRAVQPELETALIHSINLLAEKHARDLPAAMTNYLEAMSADQAWVAADNARCQAHPDIRALLKPQSRAGFQSRDRGNGLEARPALSLRHLIYSALPSVLAAALHDSGWNGQLRQESRVLGPARSGGLPARQPEAGKVITQGLTAAARGVPSRVRDGTPRSTGAAQRHFEDALRRLQTAFALNVPGTFTPQSWEQLRAVTTQLWFAACH